MQYILCVIPSRPEERLMLQSARVRRALVERAATAISSMPGAVLEIYTTDEATSRAFLAQGYSVFCDRAPEAESASPQSRLLRAFSVLRDRNRIAWEDAVIVVDYRNAHLGASAFGRVEAALADDPEGCFSSFQAARDHPAQMRAMFCLQGVEHFALPDAGTLSLREPAAGSDPWRSRPFFFDWRAMSVWQDGHGPYRLWMEADGSALQLTPASVAPRGLGPDSVLLHRESPTKARRALAVPVPPGRAKAAVPAYFPTSAFPLRLALDDASTVRWATDRRDAVFRIWPLCCGRIGPRVELAIPPGSGTQTGAFAIAPDTESLLACWFTPSRDGVYDCAFPLEGPGRWTCGPGLDDRPRDPRSNRPICNRQELAAVYAQDWSVIAGRAAGLWRGLKEGCDWRVIPLTPQEAAKVHSVLHLAVETGIRLAPESFFPGRGASPAGFSERPGEGQAAVASSGTADAATAREGEDAAGFLAARRTLSRQGFLAWQLRWRAQWAWEEPEADPFGQWVGKLLFEKSCGLESKRAFAAEITALLPQSRPIGRSRAGLVVPGKALPGKIWDLRSDNALDIYGCSQLEDKSGILWTRKLDDSRLRKVGRNTVNYRSVWFDHANDLIYGFFLDEKGLSSGIDIFDKMFRLQDSLIFPAALQGYPHFYQLYGNDRNLFVWDHCHRFVRKIDKKTLRPVDVIEIAGHELVQQAVCYGEEIFTTSIYDSTVSILGPDAPYVRHIQNTQTLFATILDYHIRERSLYVVTRRSFPRGLETATHWVHCLGRDGSLQDTRCLGETLVWRLHVMQEADVLLTVDFSGNLQAMPCRPG